MIKNKNNTEKETNLLESLLNELECPDMFKAGLKSYIERNKINIKNKTEFKKTVKMYSEVKL